MYSKLTIKTPERYQRRSFVVFIVNFEHILHLALMFLLLTLSMVIPAGFYFKTKSNSFRNQMLFFKS